MYLLTYLLGIAVQSTVSEMTCLCVLWDVKTRLDDVVSREHLLTVPGMRS